MTRAIISRGMSFLDGNRNSGHSSTGPSSIVTLPELIPLPPCLAMQNGHQRRAEKPLRNDFALSQYSQCLIDAHRARAEPSGDNRGLVMPSQQPQLTK